jgi:hypothetical protein
MPRLSSELPSFHPPVIVPKQPCARFTEEDTAIAYFGDQLLAAGYNYYGNEPMYSGITGEEFAADIYIGVVYYQRLRHMVLDKFQVRTTGPVDQVTRQPIKVRFARPPVFVAILTSHRVENALAGYASEKWSVTLSSPMERPSSSKTG